MISEKLEERRKTQDAQEYQGHSYMDFHRFMEDTRHMIIFDVLSKDSPIGNKGERARAYVTEEGYQKALEMQRDRQIRIVSHARVDQGYLRYDRKSQVR